MPLYKPYWTILYSKTYSKTYNPIPLLLNTPIQTILNPHVNIILEATDLLKKNDTTPMGMDSITEIGF